MTHKKIEYFEGIGPVFGEKFRDAGSTSTYKHIEDAQTPGQRAQLSETT